jgi:hypothetical protein
VKFSLSSPFGHHHHHSSSSNAAQNMPATNTATAAHSKRNALQRIFTKNKNPSSTGGGNSQAVTSSSSSNDPFASLNPFHKSSSNASLSVPGDSAVAAANSSNIDSILEKYSHRPSITPAQSDTAVLIGEFILKKFYFTIKMIFQLDINCKDISSDIPSVEVPAGGQSNRGSSTSQHQFANAATLAGSAALHKNLSSVSLQQQKASLLYYDPENLDQSKLFLDAKKKLRLVFSWSDYCIYNFVSSYRHK